MVHKIRSLLQQSCHKYKNNHNTHYLIQNQSAKTYHKQNKVLQEKMIITDGKMSWDINVNEAQVSTLGHHLDN